MIMRYFVWGILLVLCNFSHASMLDKFITSFNEQEASSAWIQATTKNKVNANKADLIVKNVYAHAISKNLNPQLILAMMKVESRFNSKALSSEGAKGLLQVLPKWHKDKLKGRNPFIDSVSIEVGIKILEDCLDKHKGNVYRALSCYSGGGGKKYYTKVLAAKYDLIESFKPQTLLLASN